MALGQIVKTEALNLYMPHFRLVKLVWNSIHAHLEYFAKMPAKVHSMNVYSVMKNILACTVIFV